MTERHLINTKRLASFAIIFGIVFYLSKFLRVYFIGSDQVLFVLGFLPNFGLAFSLPFIYVSNRIRLRQPIRYFGVACIVTVMLMVLNEVRDKYQTERVFDLLDVYASVAGSLLAYLFFRWTMRLQSPV